MMSGMQFVKALGKPAPVRGKVSPFNTGASTAALAALYERTIELKGRLLEFQDGAGNALRRGVDEGQKECITGLVVISARFLGVVADIQSNVEGVRRGESDGFFAFYSAAEAESIMDRAEIFCCIVEDVGDEE